MQSSQTIHCPYCQSADAVFICDKVDWDETLPFFEADYRMFRCAGCGLIYCDPLTDTVMTSMSRYFTESYNLTRGIDFRATIAKTWGLARLLSRRVLWMVRRQRRRWWRLPGLGRRQAITGTGRFAEALAILDRHGAFSVLDVGCSYGGFVAAALSCGFDAFGVEATRDIVRLIHEQGVRRVVHGSFPEQAGPRGTYDAITFFHVLMHFPALEPEFFAACRQRLRPGGAMLVFCTDPASLDQEDMAATRRSPIALNFTGASFMQRAAADAGFSSYTLLPCAAEPHCCFHLLVR